MTPISTLPAFTIRTPPSAISPSLQISTSDIGPAPSIPMAPDHMVPYYLRDGKSVPKGTHRKAPRDRKTETATQAPSPSAENRHRDAAARRRHGVQSLSDGTARPPRRDLRPVSAPAEPVGGGWPHPGRAVAPHRHRDGVLDRDPGCARGAKARHPPAQRHRPAQDQRLPHAGGRRAGGSLDGM